ncbi:MAG: DUF4919 domain-containing protein [bacterium]|jgi:hypothetical protein|nr:DUF4919 domain-containing protein [bacterium]MDD3624133.1 DUF4919 domain-containing protein [Proteiniphilum sp.]MDD3968232.1 DUF4919 domain-containing protein [Proteiniphilum sp.]MDD4458191.1 DUF4919 domain-containing protein [Proteiniphilum sp.]
MQKMTLLVTLFLLTILQGYAQDEEFFQAPDYRQIERNVREPASSYHYPKLLEKYLNSDAAMTAEEGRHLYFGYVFQSNYIPADTSRYNKLLADVLIKSTLLTDDYDRILQYSEALLQEDPFNLRALNARMLVYAQQNDAASYKAVARKRRIVQDAIVGTGDGMSEKTAFYVIKVAHEYDILPFLGFSFGGEDRILKNNRINYLSLGQNRFGVERIYFNIKPVIEHVSARGGGKL